MKIVIAAEIFPPDIGGPATYSRKLAEELTKCGFLIKLICYSTKIEADSYPFLVTRILRGQSTLKRYGQYFWHLLKLAGKDCDLIYTQGPVSSGLPAIIVGFFLGKKVAVKVVGDYAWEQARNSGETDIGIDEFQKQNLSGKAGFLKKIEKWVCQKADCVIVPSVYLENMVFDWGVPEEKIKVIYNAVSSPDLASEKIETQEDLIISVGRLVPWKGFNTLIELMPKLLETNPNFKLVILGDGPENEKLESKISNLQLKDKIEIKKVDTKTRDQYLRSATLFVLNTGYEGLPHTVLEAMAAGLPVITTNLCGNPEVVQHEYNGLLVEYENKNQLKEAILRLYQDIELQQKFIKSSKEVLKKFGFEEMLNQTINTLKILKNNTKNL